MIKYRINKEKAAQGLPFVEEFMTDNKDTIEAQGELAILGKLLPIPEVGKVGIVGSNGRVPHAPALAGGE